MPGAAKDSTKGWHGGWRLPFAEFGSKRVGPGSKLAVALLLVKQSDSETAILMYD
jgi:hypothetical protein